MVNQQSSDYNERAVAAERAERQRVLAERAAAEAKRAADHEAEMAERRRRAGL